MPTYASEREVVYSPGVAPPLQVAAVGLLVRDLDLVAAFYHDVIGLTVLSSDAGEVQLGAGGVALIHLLHRPAALADDPAGAGLFHTAFLLPSRADLGRWLVHLRAMGLGLDGAADHAVSEAVYLTDPEGNGVEVYADRPAADWPWTDPAGPRQIELVNRRLDLAALMAEAGRPWGGAPPDTRVGHVHLRVGDVARAAAFYVDALGLDVTLMTPEAAFLSSGGYHHHLGANVWRSLGAGPRDPSRAGLAWVMMEARGQADAGTSTDLRDPWGTQIKITTHSRGVQTR